MAKSMPAKPRAAKAVKMWAVVCGREVQIVYAYRKSAREMAADAQHINGDPFYVEPVLVSPLPTRRASRGRR